MTSQNIFRVAAAIGVAAIVWYYFLGLKEPGSALAEVTVPSSFNSLASEGEALFNENCAACHGKNAAGQSGVAPPLVHVIYEPSHHNDAAFFRAAKKGVRGHHWPFGDMPPVAGIMDQEIERIVAYIRTLQRANGIN